MGGSYRQCSECGKRALSIATRCPGCGRDLPAPATPVVGRARGPRRFLPPKVVAGIIATTVILTVAGLVRTSRPAIPEAEYDMTATARLDSATAAALPAASAGELLVARTWTNVRKSRRKSADLEALLMPGDTVLADSLERGWYRVALEGEVLGYVHRSTLTLP
ncbi:MAG: hypothetical protein ACREMX_08700 [Gemmatimonadales bacterium]